jgi:hypothetical protein
MTWNISKSHSIITKRILAANTIINEEITQLLLKVIPLLVKGCLQIKLFLAGMLLIHEALHQTSEQISTTQMYLNPSNQSWLLPSLKS